MRTDFFRAEDVKSTVKKLLVILLLCSVGTGLVQAETRYVSDVCEVTLRSGKSTSHRILRLLRSGTPLNVLETDTESGYSRVRTDEGKEGWVLERQLMTTPSAREQLEAAQRRLDELQSEPGKLSAKLAKLQGEHSTLTQRYSQLRSQRDQLERELKQLRHTSENAVRISNERDSLRGRVTGLDRKVQELEQKNRDLKNRTAQNWFLIGGGVVVIGIILGLILPHLRFQRRKDSWGTL
jgi:SH3 domain protein